jgi:signal transduction histidine kinase
MAALVELLLGSVVRYRMAVDLHEEAVREDYAALQQKHAALEISEARYRKLNEELEQRVREQVATIDAAQRQLYQVEKLASVGQLAAGVAHEINNPIGFIRSNLNTARRYADTVRGLQSVVATGDAAQIAAAWQRLDMDFVLGDFVELIDDSIAGADRVARIVTDLKGFSNVDRPEEAVIDLNDNLRSACNVMATRLPPGATIEQDLQPLPPFLCLPGHLNQVFLNVLLNAAQAVAPETGRVAVRSRAVDGEIRIEIGDNGCGIAPEDLPRVFDPFFTTRGVGQGTGLGLTVGRDIVLVHNGRMDIASRPGAGTTVTITLPV